MEKTDRSTEWFVPRWGPTKFKIFMGLLFLPYTGMVLSFFVLGSMLSETVYWDRVVAGLWAYFLGLGISAHALDALGSKGIKPWGEHFTRRQLWMLAAGCLVGAYAILIYYILTRDLRLLWIIAILEGFFAFAYNLEWFKGRFHTDGWFCFSWGILPVLAGYIMQTNSVSMAAVIMAGSMGLLSWVEITASRPYKELKRSLRSGIGPADPQSLDHLIRYERILKSISLGVILLGISFLVFRLWP